VVLPSRCRTPAPAGGAALKSTLPERSATHHEPALQFTCKIDEHHESLLLAGEMGDEHGSVALLPTMAALALAEGDAERAACLKGAELAIRERQAIPAVPVGQESSEELVTQIRASLDEETFANARTRGRSRSLEEIVADAPSATLTDSPGS